MNCEPIITVFKKLKKDVECLNITAYHSNNYLQLLYREIREFYFTLCSQEQFLLQNIQAKLVEGTRGQVKII